MSTAKTTMHRQCHQTERYLTGLKRLDNTITSQRQSTTYIQHVFNQLGPIEIWALSTTAEDTALRAMLYEGLGSKAARRLLAKRFPSGSAKDTIERRLAEFEDRGVAVDEKVRGNAIRQLADELLKEAS